MFEKPNRILFIDTETGGLDYEVHDLLTIGLVAWEDGVVKGELELKISKPEYVVTEEALKVNGLNLDQLRLEGTDKETTVKLIAEFVRKHFGSKPAVIAGHNVHFDIAFLKKLFKNTIYKYDAYFSHRVLDTMCLLRFLFLAGLIPELGKLDQAIEFFGIITPEELRHTALEDTKITVKVFDALLGMVTKNSEKRD